MAKAHRGLGDHDSLMGCVDLLARLKRAQTQSLVPVGAFAPGVAEAAAATSSGLTREERHALLSEADALEAALAAYKRKRCGFYNEAARIWETWSANLCKICIHT
eukprot:GHVT01037177.1.p1 GENE.GHVT01037177.1~~GHVT01037177.1.p1  ORF type:complete len:105 (-),score=27.42 GHVT01037177.1:352-666(-)